MQKGAVMLGKAARAESVNKKGDRGRLTPRHSVGR